MGNNLSVLKGVSSQCLPGYFPGNSNPLTWSRLRTNNLKLEVYNWLLIDIPVSFNNTGPPTLGTSRAAVKEELQKVLSPACITLNPPTYPIFPPAKTYLGHYCPKLCFPLTHLHPPPNTRHLSPAIWIAFRLHGLNNDQQFPLRTFLALHSPRWLNFW